VDGYFNGRGRRYLILERREFLLDWRQPEDNGPAQNSAGIRHSRLFVCGDELKLAQKPVRPPMAHHLEQQQSLVVSEMFTDGTIASAQNIFEHLDGHSLISFAEKVTPI
jgi:hypothetical protein